MPFDSFLKQDAGNQQELHPVDLDHPFEAEGITVHESALAGGSVLPFTTLHDLDHDFCRRGIRKDFIIDNASSIFLLTPKDEVSHLVRDVQLGAYDACEMNGRLTSRNKASSKAIKKADAVKGHWTLEEDRSIKSSQFYS
ncbi:hypothetical protein E2562_014235 [Oryza meyeriana var. granulata]|uniref:Uncharacterized protein n=1 Tax=Oryza meyeriana var. granulata TaxID=110450 RepID=A0A6G1BKD6_9ORYZ|nr:hypothetical protein E2562_014235 [Oryza meyeriana var. granulata]